MPRELINLAEYVEDQNVTSVDDLPNALEKFENTRVDLFESIARKYYNNLPENEQNRYYYALTSMFLPSRFTANFDWKFLDLGLIYQFKEGGDICYFPLPICSEGSIKYVYVF